MLGRLHNDQQRQDDDDIRAKNEMDRLQRQLEQTSVSIAYEG